jgi:pectate lyase
MKMISPKSSAPLAVFLMLAGIVHLHAATPSFEQIGFSTVAAYGLSGTTGGGDAKPTVVRTVKEFQIACERLDLKNKNLRDHTPRVVLVATNLDLGELANVTGNSTGKSVGIVRVRPNTTIYSTDGATIRRGTIEVHGAWNVIIRNLRFRDLWEFDPTGKYDRLGWDFVRISNAGEARSHHVWVDHCDFEKAYDGLLDIVHGSDCITVSWNRFAGDDRGPQKKVSLIGHSSGPTAAALDQGYLNVTLHHNWFTNIEDRAPRARFGNIHALNNLIEGAHYATISVDKAVTLVEGCVYRDARVATSFSHAKDSVSRERGGFICLVDSRNISPRETVVAEKADERFEQENNFKANVERAKLEFNAPSGFAWTNRNELPYRYRADAADAVTPLVKENAGVGKLKLAGE